LRCVSRLPARLLARRLASVDCAHKGFYTLLMRTKWLQELACAATRYFWGLSLAESGMMIKARFNCRSGARTFRS
jgi:hypothetical protein